MKVGKWSIIASNNNATPPDGWPEGQAPSTVNDCARENMAAIRTLVSDLQFVDLAHTPSFLTATTFSLGTADVANFEVGRRLKLFDATTLYGTIDSVSGTFVSVRLDSGAQLTSSLTSVAVGIMRNTTNALPEAAYSQQNTIINGDMDVWQRGTFFGNPANFTYTADRFMYEESGLTGSGSVVQKTRAVSASSVPTTAQAGRFINNSLAFITTATQSTMLSTDYCMLSYVVEGFDWRGVAHQQLGLGFWCATNKSGVYSVVVRSELVSASYVTCFTVTAVNVMQHFFLQLPEAPDNPYQWNYSTGAGLRISWVMAAGTDNMIANPNTWTATNVVAVTAQVNLFEEPFNEFIITGVTLKRGWADVPLVARCYGNELSLCQRYYWRGLPGYAVNGNCYTAGAILAWPVAFPSTMRGVPIMNSVVPGVSALGLTGLTVDAATASGFRMLAIGFIGHPNANLLFDPDSDYFEASAEL